MKVNETGLVVCPEVVWKETTQISFHVEIHSGGLFLYFLIADVSGGKKEALRLFFLERDGNIPKRRKNLGLALPVEMLPVCQAETIPFAELFEKTNGCSDSIIANLEKKLVGIFVKRGTFRIEVREDAIHFSLTVIDPGCVLSTYAHVSELKKFCKAGPSG